jgi:Flp pilus assembly protein TadD
MRVVSKISLMAAAFSLAACATSRTPEEQALAQDLTDRGSIVPASQQEREAIRSQDLLTQAAFWAEAHELNPADREAAIELSRVLRRIGQSQRAATVARQAMALYPDDIDLHYVYGAALTEGGRGAVAIESLSRVSAARPTDWRVFNILGVAYEQAGMRPQSREQYRQALALAPGEAAVLSNLALSFAFDGDAAQAERLLREAMARPQADATVRQNLALVIALQGRFDEAEAMARVDVSPQTAEANMAYVRAMLTTGRRWDAIRDDSGAP